MKTFCGCMSTKSGTLAILGLYFLVAISGIVFSSVKISNDDFGEIQKQIDIPEECSVTGEKNDSWWCKIITNEDNFEKDVCIAKIFINVFLLIFTIVAIYGTTGGKAFFILPFVVYEFLCLLLFITVVVLIVLVLGVYSPGGVDITTTVSVGVIGAIWTVILFYVWLCVVSHYQILREISSLGSDQVKVLQEWEDDAAMSKYDRFDEPDPHADDYPMDKDDMPPSYEPPAGSVLSVKDSAKIEDIEPKVDDIP